MGRRQKEDVGGAYTLGNRFGHRFSDNLRHLGQLQLDLDGHLVADEPAARLQRHVPVQAQSLRLMVVLPEKPALVVPHGVLSAPA